MKHARSPSEATLRRFKALADGKRLRILLQLASGERCVCELTDALDSGQSLLSFHLRTLKDAGLVTDRRAGRWVHYSIDPAGLATLEAFLRGVRESAAAAAGRADQACEPRFAAGMRGAGTPARMKAGAPARVKAGTPARMKA